MLTIEAVTALKPTVVNCISARRRGGRVAECGGLLNCSNATVLNSLNKIPMP